MGFSLDLLWVELSQPAMRGKSRLGLIQGRFPIRLEPFLGWSLSLGLPWKGDLYIAPFLAYGYKP